MTSATTPVTASSRPRTRVATVRLQPAQRQLRPGNPRGAGQSLPGRRRQPRAQGQPDPKAAAAPARRRPVATPQRPGGRRHQPRQQAGTARLSTACQLQPGARDKSFAQLVGVPSAVLMSHNCPGRSTTHATSSGLGQVNWPVDRGRRTWRGEAPQLPAAFRVASAQPQRGGRRRHLRGARHALLRGKGSRTR